MLLKMARTRRRRISFVRNVRRTIVEATYPAISDDVTMALNPSAVDNPERVRRRTGWSLRR
jgi:hypothetical protein